MSDATASTLGSYQSCFAAADAGPARTPAVARTATTPAANRIMGTPDEFVHSLNGLHERASASAARPIWTIRPSRHFEKSYFSDASSLRCDDVPLTRPCACGANKTPGVAAAFWKRMMGLEPTTFCMASRRSSQLSYIRADADYSGGIQASRASLTRRSARSLCSRRTDGL